MKEEILAQLNINNVSTMTKKDQQRLVRWLIAQAKEWLGAGREDYPNIYKVKLISLNK